MKVLALATVLITLGAPAYAQNGSSPGFWSGNSSADARSEPERITQEIRRQLESAGMKDVKVMPQTFLVEAKDQNDNIVHMAINGNSIMSVTELSPSTTGSGSSGGSNNNSNGMTGSSSAESPNSSSQE